MKKIHKCRVCGYIVEREDPPHVCPACGVKGKIFEEYESPISKKRRKALAIHAHPVMVHFPIAFVSSMLLISLSMIIGVIKEQSVFMNMLRSIVLILPFASVLATIAGMVDGKLRFKRINTPYLKRKLLLAGSFIFISISLFIIQNILHFDHSSYTLIILIYSIVLTGLGLNLGLIGGKLLDSKVRG